MAESNIERILNITTDEPNEKAVETLAIAMDDSPAVQRVFEQIASRNDFSEQYNKIISAVRLGETFGVTDVSIVSRILENDVTSDIMEDAIAAAHKDVPIEILSVVFHNMTENIENGCSLDEAQNRAVDIMGCLGNKVPVSLEKLQQYSSEQLERLSDISGNIVNLSSMNERHSIRTKEQLTDYLYKLFDDCHFFDQNRTPDQMDAIWGVVASAIPFDSWDGIVSPKLSEIINIMASAINSHNSYSDVYKNIINSGTDVKDMTVEEVWTQAKEEEVKNKICKSFEAVNFDDPIHGLTQICQKIGLSNEQTQKVAEQAEPLINQNSFLKEHDSENLDIRCIADMLIEGIPSEDVFDYLGATDCNKDTLEVLYQCFHEGLDKDVTVKCLSKELNPSQLNEVMIAEKNNCTIDQQLQLCDSDKSPTELCKMRLLYQKQNDIDDGKDTILADIDMHSQLSELYNTESVRGTSNLNNDDPDGR